MDSEATLQRMIAAGIVDTDGDRVYPTEEFESARDRLREEGDHGKPDWLTAERVDGDHLDPEFVVTAKAVDAVADGMDRREIGVVATVLDRLTDPPTADGAPREFVPLYQEDIRGFLRQHEASVLFVWKPGSTSCERMATTLGQLHSLPLVDESVGLGSICVEDGAELLREEYDVGVLPTTLFFVGESVDSRTIGPRELDYVKREVEIITDAASESGGSGRQGDA